VRPLLGQSEVELGRWRDALSEALGSNGQLIVNLVLAPVDLVAGNLRRFSVGTQEALKQFACLGNVAEVATLTVVHGVKEEAVHVALWEAVHAGLVFRLNSAYKFMHDRIQQAAYSLIPEEQRAEVHLRIGRVLLASMTADELAEHLFDVATQFNRGASRLVDRDEKAQVATIGLRTGQKAKASAAYASACVYFAVGTALLDERNWGSRYELMSTCGWSARSVSF
jgi:predicted ATPase